jgi:glycerol-3-phosphate dehydrogenase (NAD(P)+)
MAKVVILGAGVMGSAMAMPACAAGHRVALVGTDLDNETVRSVQGNGWHPRLGLPMPEGVTAHSAEALGEVLGDDTDLLVLGVSSVGVGWAIDRLAETLRRPLPVLMITKGLSARNGVLQTLPAVVARAVEERTGVALPIMAVGGPCIAGELAAERDTSVVIAGGDRALIERAIALLGVPFYHARASTDLIGVETCAAFKNFYAIAVGSAAGRLEREGKASNGALAHNLAASLFAKACRSSGCWSRPSAARARASPACPAPATFT